MLSKERSKIPLAEPEIGEREWSYVRMCLESGWISSRGELVERFERRVADVLGRAHAVATTSGTAALHLALLLVGVRPGDEVVVPTLTFVATANVARYIGAEPVFVDCEPNYCQIDVEKLTDFLKHECQPLDGRLVNRSTGRRIAAIVPVHILGHPVDADPLLKVAADFDIPVVEDATEALGAEYRSRPVGALSPIGCLSFNGNKIVTSGGGGMVLVDREEWSARARYLATQARDDAIEYVHNEVGFNFRLSSLHAAVGLAQMERLEEFVARRRAIARRYADGLRDIPGLRLLPEAAWARSIFWLSTVLVSPRVESSRPLLRRLLQEGIEGRPIWQPLHRNAPYRSCLAYRCEVADEIYRRALHLPSSVGMTPADQDRVIDAIRSATLENIV